MSKELVSSNLLFAFTREEKELLISGYTEKRAEALLAIQDRRGAIFPGYTLIDKVYPIGYTSSDVKLADRRVLEGIYDREGDWLEIFANLLIYADSGMVTTGLLRKDFEKKQGRHYPNKFYRNIRTRISNTLRDYNLTIYIPDNSQPNPSFYLRDLTVAPLLTPKAA